MRTVNYRDAIMAGIGGLLSVDERDLQPEMSRSWASRINSWVRKGWDYWQWKQLRLTEERAFRQVRYEELNYAEGTEVYDLDQDGYYRALEEIAPGESPETDPEKWELIADLDRYIATEQYGKQNIGKVIAINPSNPRTCRRQRKLPYSLSNRGIDLAGCGGNTVWITYQVEQPVFTQLEYDPQATYLTDSLVYDPLSGECYRAIKDVAPVDDGDNQPPTNALYWMLQEFPYLLAEYVTYGAASDLADDVATKRSYSAEAEERIVREINGQEEQGDISCYSLREQPRYRFGWQLDPTLIAA